MAGRAPNARVELPPFLRRTSTRVTAAVGLTACALVGAATFLSSRQTFHALESAESFHLSSLAQLLVDTVRAPVAFEESGMVQDSLRTLAPSLPGVVWVEVTTPGGARIADWERIPGLRANADPSSIAALMLPVRSVNDEEVLAYVQVATSRDGIAEAEAGIRTIALLTLAVTILIAFFMSLFLGRYQLGLEERVIVRTAEVVAAKQEVSDILDNMAQAIFTVRADGLIRPEFSAFCRNLFGADDISGRTVAEILGISLEGWLSTVIGADRLQWKLSKSHPPAEVRLRGRTLELSYAPIYENRLVDRVMFICRDVTEVRKLTDALDRVTQLASIDPELLGVFLDETHQRIDTMRDVLMSEPSPQAIASVLRNLHTLKGNARSYGLRGLAKQAHETESLLQQLRDGRADDDTWTQVSFDLDKIAELADEFQRLARDVLKKSAPGTAKDRDRLKPIVEAAGELSRRFEQSFAGIGAHEREQLSLMLQQVMELRLVPVSALVPRLEGVAQDVAKQLGKPTPAWETSLDGVLLEPPVLEKLSGALTHLVRNAIDHGIEDPERRRMASKADRGCLALNASVSGDRLSIELRDDGRGIDPDRIRNVALNRHLITEQHPALEDDDAAISLLFEPGFTTAPSVTDISGRGVGLDAVRSWIREMGGEVGIHTRVGLGTTFTMSLPLTASRSTSAPSSRGSST